MYSVEQIAGKHICHIGCCSVFQNIPGHLEGQPLGVSAVWACSTSRTVLAQILVKFGIRAPSKTFHIHPLQHSPVLCCQVKLNFWLMVSISLSFHLSFFSLLSLSIALSFFNLVASFLISSITPISCSPPLLLQCLWTPRCKEIL